MIYDPKFHDSIDRRSLSGIGSLIRLHAYVGNNDNIIVLLKLRQLCCPFILLTQNRRNDNDHQAIFFLISHSPIINQSINDHFPSGCWRFPHRQGNVIFCFCRRMLQPISLLSSTYTSAPSLTTACTFSLILTTNANKALYCCLKW